MMYKGGVVSSFRVVLPMALRCTLLAAVVAGCEITGPDARIDWLSGTYSLVEFNDQPLPAVISQFPSSRVDQTPSPCFLMMGEGSLRFAAGKVEFRYRSYGSCSGATNTDAYFTGELVRFDSSFHMIVPLAGREPMIFEGFRIGERRVLVPRGEWNYVFERMADN
jgi:hypothetical protein